MGSVLAVTETVHRPILQRVYSVRRKGAMSPAVAVGSWYMARSPDLSVGATLPRRVTRLECMVCFRIDCGRVLPVETYRGADRPVHKPSLGLIAVRVPLIDPVSAIVIVFV